MVGARDPLAIWIMANFYGFQGYRCVIGGGEGDGDQRKLPLRRHPIHRRVAARDGNPLHLLVLHQAGRPLGRSGHRGRRSRLDLPVGQLSGRTSSLRDLRLRHMAAFTALESAAKRPIPGAFRVQVNAWLLRDFDPGAQPIGRLGSVTSRKRTCVRHLRSDTRNHWRSDSRPPANPSTMPARNGTTYRRRKMRALVDRAAPRAEDSSATIEAIT
jgi:hypothetical protein